MDITLSTHNRSKIAEIKEALRRTPIKIFTLKDRGIEGYAPEDGTTLWDNARNKAAFPHSIQPDRWAMADDSGIFIRALKGKPGVKTAVWAGEHATTQEITQHCCKQMLGKEDRSAIFITVVALISPTGANRFFEGSLHGTLLEEPRVPPRPQMPYSALFVPQGEKMCLAEMSFEHENDISHRSQAFRNMLDYLKIEHLI